MRILYRIARMAVVILAAAWVVAVAGIFLAVAAAVIVGGVVSMIADPTPAIIAVVMIAVMTLLAVITMLAVGVLATAKDEPGEGADGR